MDQPTTILSHMELIGQDKAKSLVERTMRSGRMPHAYVFKGPDGVGKKLFARGLAATLNCRGETPGSACGVCSSCKKFLSDNHPDYMVIRPEKGTIKIDQIREMCRTLGYAPYESDLRVVLLEDVHTMRQEAANSLLKTLEEPPAGNLLILTAEASQEVLTTISSRCQVIPFFGLPAEQCAELLRQLAPVMDKEQAMLLARLAEGSPGKALLLHETELLSIAGKIIATVSDAGVDSNRDVGVLLKVAQELSELKEHIPPLLGLLRLWLRDLLLIPEGGGDAYNNWQKPLVAVGPDIAHQLKSWSSEDLFAKLQAVDTAEKQLKRNCNRTLVCEVLIFHLHGGTS
ncbi:DNA polymerase III subunit delta' [Desulfosediminicola ganghwensis]|uniref:DNA polymerase III subunit delta' n=1 Tax=Desulfosediminicola ganghwensis TaxID=2569540 RepID=UPI0010AD6B4A|nr:DNA polymerase III subunit delta' [Desulfosediminicola ganghwensis]